jgi:hypothetical protein
LKFGELNPPTLNFRHFDKKIRPKKKTAGHEPESAATNVTGNQFITSAVGWLAAWLAG